MSDISSAIVPRTAQLAVLCGCTMCGALLCAESTRTYPDIGGDGRVIRPFWQAVVGAALVPLLHCVDGDVVPHLLEVRPRQERVVLHRVPLLFRVLVQLDGGLAEQADLLGVGSAVTR